MHKYYQYVNGHGLMKSEQSSSTKKSLHITEVYIYIHTKLEIKGKHQ